MLNALFKMPLAGWLIFLSAAGSLAFAFTMQYGFDVEPCVLCLWQRVPFAVAACLALTAALWKPYGHFTKIILIMITASFAIGCGLAIFHTGVELHWWLGTSGCAITPLNAATTEDLRAQLLHTVVARCDQISWTLFGLSMANYNVALSGGLAVFTGLVAARTGREK